MPHVLLLGQCTPPPSRNSRRSLLLSLTARPMKVTVSNAAWFNNDHFVIALVDVDPDTVDIHLRGGDHLSPGFGHVLDFLLHLAENHCHFLVYPFATDHDALDDDLLLQVIAYGTSICVVFESASPYSASCLPLWTSQTSIAKFARCKRAYRTHRRSQAISPESPESPHHRIRSVHREVQHKVVHCRVGFDDVSSSSNSVSPTWVSKTSNTLATTMPPVAD